MIEGNETPEVIRFITERWIFVLDKRSGTWARVPNEPMLDISTVEEKPEIPAPEIKTPAKKYIDQTLGKEDKEWARG